MYIEYNPNPCGRKVGDCAVRAISKALDVSWEAAYISLALNGLQMCDVISSDAVSGSVLRQHGFKRYTLPNSCPECYTAEEFCKEYPVGTYVLYFGGHVACVDSGTLYDAWDSSNEIVQYYWTKEEI